MKIEENGDYMVIRAEAGKVLRRISDGYMAGERVHLGYTYQLGGVKLAVPLKELAEHYEEVDAPAKEAWEE